jgi:hypothetical protein
VDELFDLEDELGMMTPLGMMVVAGVFLDEEERCTCPCVCDRERDLPDAWCEPCRNDRHQNDD